MPSYRPITRNPFLENVPPQEKHSNPPEIGSHQHNSRSSNHRGFGNRPATYYPPRYSASMNSQYTQHNATTGLNPSYQQPTIANELNPQQPFTNGPNVKYPPPHLVYTPKIFSNFDPHGLQPKDYANFPPFTLSRHELRSQLNSIGREISLQTVGSTTTASKHAAYLGNPQFLMLYLVVLGQFLTQGGQVHYVKLPPPSPENFTSISPTTSSFSSTLPFKQNTSKRGRGKSEAFGGRESSRRKLSPVDTTDSVPEFTPLTSTDATPNTDSLAEFSRPVPSRQHVTIEFGDAVSISLDLDKPPGGRSEPVKTAGYPFPVVDSESLKILTLHEKSPIPAISSTASTVSTLSIQSTPDSPSLASIPARTLAPKPLLLPISICFIRCNPDQGIRIRILPETMENSEITWIDLPGIWIHTTEQKLPEGVFVMGFSSWIYSQHWISALYQEVLIHASLRGSEEEYVKSGYVREAPSTVFGYQDGYMKPTFDPTGNPKPVHRTIHYPSGDDLGVNWSASEAENTKTRLANTRRMWEKWQGEARESRWLWYLWRRFGLLRGWTKEPEEFGDRMRNKDNVEELRRMAFLARPPVGFEDMNEALDGEDIDKFKSRWEIRHNYFGGPKWEGL
ncbi:hypothetical protein EAF04_001425 [Stromatinia cepivora]|nr:hypothetical protein EAF04_001425 [Stromatinia cepivora]